MSDESAAMFAEIARAAGQSPEWIESTLAKLTPEPADRADQMYRWLHGARESLCSAQQQLAVVSWRAMLGKAVAHIDYVGSRECGEQWSRFDRDDQLATRAEPVEAETTEAVWSLRRIYDELAWRVTDHNTERAVDMLRWHVERGEQTVAAEPTDGPVNGAPSVTVHRSYTTDRPTAVDVDVTHRTLTMHTHGIPGGEPYDLDPDEALALAYDLATAAHVLGGLDR